MPKKPPARNPRSKRALSPHRLHLRLGLIADDLAGACDAGVQFAQRGFLSIVHLGPASPACDVADLKILNTNTRNDSPKIARAKILQALRILEKNERELTYKKIDSTLRANLGVEIQAAMSAHRLAIVAPAFPAMGRLIRDGCLHVAGTPTKRPVSLVKLLCRQTGTRVLHIHQRFLAGGVADLHKRLEEISRHGRSIVVLDTGSQHHLAIIARAAWKLPEPPLLVGSAALAAEIAKLLRGEHRGPRSTCKAERRSARLSGCGGPVALIVGFTHPVTAAQVNHLLAHRPTTRITLEGDYMPAVRRALQSEHHLLIHAGQSASDERDLARLSRILAYARVRGIIATGGDTANLVVRALKANGIILAWEILPGVPWGRLAGGRARGKPIATKAGGFGRPNTLALMADFLSRLRT